MFFNSIVVGIGVWYSQYLPNFKYTPGECITDVKIPVIEITLDEQVFQEYKIKNKKDYVIDYLIPNELGGTNRIKNLWPQSLHGKWNWYMKNELKGKFIELIRKHKIELRVAQLHMAQNWIWAYEIYVRRDYENDKFWNN